MRARTRKYISDYPVLDISAIAKLGLIDDLSGTSSGSANNRVLWSLDWCCSSETITVRYNLGGVRYTHDIAIEKQPVNYGGDRLYLRCSMCSSMRKKIYFVGSVAACRSCHGLCYQSQSENKEARKYRKLDRLLSRVKPFGYRFDGYYKIKFKHWCKYYEYDRQISSLQDSIFADIRSRFNVDTCF